MPQDQIIISDLADYVETGRPLDACHTVHKTKTQNHQQYYRLGLWHKLLEVYIHSVTGWRHTCFSDHIPNINQFTSKFYCYFLL